MASSLCEETKVTMEEPVTAAYTEHREDAALTPPFHSADQRYGQIKQLVESDEMRKMTHDAIERRLEREGRELMRCLLADHLTVRGQAIVLDVGIPN
jgi:hypothetical protein